MKFRGFRRDTSRIHPGPEERERKRISWGKFVYLTILGIVAIGLLKIGFRKIFLIEGLGVVDARRVSVAGDITGRVQSITCSINDRISKGEPLVFLEQPELEHEFSIREMDLQGELRVLESQRDKLSVEMGLIREEYRRARELLAAEAITVPDFLEIERDMQRSDRELSLLQARAFSTRKQLEEFRRKYYDDSDGIPGDGHGEHLRESILYSPVDGLVTLVHRMEGEVAREGEPILEVADLSELFIRTYFKESDEKDIIVGEEVSILFENGDRTVGRIARVYPSTLPLPVQFLSQYERRERHIIAEIVPEEGGLWPAILETRARVNLYRNIL